MSNRSIAWWLRRIGLPQYTQTLEREYYGLEGLLMVTDGDLMSMGVEDADHRETILTNLQKHQQSLQPGSPTVQFLASPLTHTERFQARGKKVSRKFSLSSSDLFRQSIVPRFSRRDNHTLSISCSNLHPLDDRRHTISIKPKHSKRKSVGVFITQVFSSRKDMDSLKKELEEELKLSTDDIRSHAWYHGQLQREAAEELLKNDGDFLVRDSSTSGGDYVLSCMWKKQYMHFKIIRIVLRPKQGYSRELFQFENDQFDNIAALVRFHVGGRRPISQASGAVITHPVTRTLPLRVINERQAVRSSSTSSATAPHLSGEKGKRRSLSSTHMDMLQFNSYNLLRSGSQPANLETVGRPSLQSAQSDSNLRPAVPQSTPAQDPLSPVFRTGSDPLLSPGSTHSHNPSQLAAGGCTLRGSDGQLHSRAPPKPIRVSTLFPANSPTIPRIEVNPASLYDELVPQIPQSMMPKGPAARLRAQEKWTSRARITETSFAFLEAQRDEEEQEAEVEKKERDRVTEVARNGDDWRFLHPETETTSSFRLDAFRSLLLPDNNRPLEQSVLHSLKELFARTDVNTTALHMLSVDCQVARVTGVTEEQKRMMGVNSGLELITLPHGSQLRQDLLERHHLLALGVAVDVLGCTSSVNQRALVLHKAIQLAQALRSTAHDLYAFSAIMKALELPQLTRLEMTWRVLRRNHTESAVMFEKTLKPFMKALNEGDESVVSGPLSLPHMVPLLKLMEGEDGVENSERGCQLLYNILQSSRHAANHANDYQQHAHTLLSGWEPIPELLEVFHTEFALRLFWGHAGAEAGRKERYEKFDKILTILSNKLEPAQPSEL
ncbi:breast cancer anti-estrogen resistance protein 3 homolog isoform X2 [Pangasianodon hypophthalmus]|uniref:breast cancer anti-estrogen resistance protein 3 homolog isoform X2 n=1 Tax=Pangasianodon hypophthalmus TaxID=310915 RepID=UPI00230816BC|nr:breast cancer anti-estrogen resistance protein 3 homolog isoform X2 [Pangasianodon hypophthalmus]